MKGDSDRWAQYLVMARTIVPRRSQVRGQLRQAAIATARALRGLFSLRGRTSPEIPRGLCFFPETGRFSRKNREAIEHERAITEGD